MSKPSLAIKMAPCSRGGGDDVRRLPRSVAVAVIIVLSLGLWALFLEGADALLGLLG